MPIRRPLRSESSLHLPRSCGWGQQVIVDNRPGGNGIVGMEIAARSNPDGYTLVLGTIGPVAVNYIKSEIRKYEKVVQASGVKAD